MLKEEIFMTILYKAVQRSFHKVVINIKEIVGSLIKLLFK